MDPKRFAWPNGARIAVLTTVLLESWSPGKGPGYFPRTSTLPPGSIDHGAVQWGEFGGKEGIWRLLRVLARRDIPATVACSGRSAELYPEAIKAVVAAGHDVAAHGYAQDEILAALPPDRQRVRLRLTIDLLEQVSARRVEGWVSAAYGWDQHTADLLVQHGMHWHADALDTSLPRRQDTASGALVAFPWSDFVDNRVLRASPRDFFDSYKDQFDYLYENEPMSLLHIAVHSHFGGRPLISAQLAKLFSYLKEFPQIWFVRHGELARQMLDGELAVPTLKLKFFS
jgi:allantoinase